MTLYFFGTYDSDAGNVSNWFEDTGGTIGASALPTTGDDAVFLAGIADSTAAIYGVNSITIENGATVSSTGDTIASVSGYVGDNNGNILVVANGGYVANSNGTIDVVQAGGAVNTNAGSTNDNRGNIAANLGTVSANNGGGNVANISGGTVVVNYSGGTVTNYAGGTVQTNNSGGTVHQYGGSILTNNGTAVIGTIQGGTGTIAAPSATNLASHTAGANVTLPAGAFTSW